MDNIGQKLSELGLTANEIQVYIHLIEKGSAKPAFIANEIGIRRPNVYVVLDKLMEYGLIEILPGLKGKVYAPNDVGQSLQDLVKKEQEKVDGKAKLADELTSALGDLRKGITDSKAVEVFPEGARSILAISDLFRSVKSELINITHPPYISTLLHNNNEDEDISDDETKPGYRTGSPQKDVRNYRLYQVKDISLSSIRNVLRKSLSANSTVKLINETPAKLLIFDRRYIATGAISPDSGEPVEDTVIIHNPGLAEMLAGAFFDIFDTLPEVTSLDDAEKQYRQIKNDARP